MARSYWLIKSEPDVFSIDHLIACPDQTEHWDGIRNYQARNFMRDKMAKGDLALFYHSNAGDLVGAVGVAEVVSDSAYPDFTAWDPKSKYYDEKSSEDNPRWFMVDFKYRVSFPELVTLKAMKADSALEDMLVVQRGQRLSIQPVEAKHFKHVCKLGGLKAKEISSL